MLHRNATLAALLPFFVLLWACSPDQPGSGTSDGDDSGPPGSTDGDSGSSNPPDSDGGSTPGDGAMPPAADGGAPGDGGSVTDSGTPPMGQVNAHIDDSCSLAVFAGFQITIGSMETTCKTRHDADERLQITVGETTGAPPEGGRTYTIVPSGESPYPADGEAYAVLTGDSTGSGESGTITITPAGSERFTGDYDVTLSDESTKSGSFTSDRCPREPGDCE